METIEMLNVTLLEPRMKHPTIFEWFDRLEGGDAFLIHNDHDPKPLYYQLIGERGNTFTWEYLLEGPEIWEVKIGKLAIGEESPTIGQLVSKDYRKAEVFKKFGLDFCCGGKKTLDKACREKGLDVVQVEKELKELDKVDVSPSHDFNTWDAGFLADYIINTHHKYVKQALPILFDYSQKVAKVHGDRHPEAIEIANIYNEIMREFVSHMMKEEKVLFPFIKKLSEAEVSGEKIERPYFGTVDNPITMMEDEHDAVGEMMRRINELSSGYTPPAGACTTYRLCYAKLKEFEDDLFEHIHLENNILFPKALEMEKKLA